MSIPPLPAPIPGATAVNFDVAAANQAIAALTRLKSSLGRIDEAAARNGMVALARWNGCAADWFSQQFGLDTFSTVQAQGIVENTITAIETAAFSAAIEQNQHNDTQRAADAARAAEAQRAADAQTTGATR